MLTTSWKKTAIGTNSRNTPMSAGARVLTSSLGFPRMGPHRELKFALEKFWKGTMNEEALWKVAHSVEEEGWKLQQQAGMDHIPIGDYYLYDMVLTWCEIWNLCPQRFNAMEPGLKRMFAMARGTDEAEALSMKKWITSNYHYMVPEYDATTRIRPQWDSYLREIRRGVDFLGPSMATPVLLGPVSLVHLIKIHVSCFTTPAMILEELLPHYQELLRKVRVEYGVEQVQIHEPALVFREEEDDDLRHRQQPLLSLFERAYPHILGPAKAMGLQIHVVSYMDDIGEANLQWICQVPEIDVVSLDMTRGRTLELLARIGPTSLSSTSSPGPILGLGMVDGRNVWRVRPSFVRETIDQLHTVLPHLSPSRIRIHPSSSLQFVPWTLTAEQDTLGGGGSVGGCDAKQEYHHPAYPVLAFAQEKLSEVRLVAEYIEYYYSKQQKKPSLEDPLEKAGYTALWTQYESHLKKGDDTSSAETAAAAARTKWTEGDLSRAEPFTKRRPQQLQGLPPLPTTTIGSFPQTNEIRVLRQRWRKGEINLTQYQAEIDKHIAYAIGIQQAIGLDILVHGEAERTDMVEFFAEQLDGMLFTSQGWVQSFGSRCVRPPIIWNTIHRPTPMTVREYRVAQTLAHPQPVKGMLTGPITILNWSFPRIDISRREQAFQIAYAIRQEVADLENAGCTIIQVDEPALREGMPLQQIDRDEYWQWTVDAFRLATAGAASGTQIHTHMCYCEFKDCMDPIDRMDTDVNSIENARNGNETLEAFVARNYSKGFGPGVYDIHSPVVPPVDMMEAKIRSFLDCLSPEQLVINPDCGLKTRSWPETIAALKNLVEATKKVRRTLSSSNVNPAPMAMAKQ